MELRRPGGRAQDRLRRHLHAAPRDVRALGVPQLRARAQRARAARRHAAVRRRRSGKKEETALSFEDLRKKVLDVAREGVPLQRFKGLGEMNPDQLFDTTMDAERRTLQQVTIDDAAAADQIFSMLMGDKVEPRREFIEANARDVTNLDV